MFTDRLTQSELEGNHCPITQNLLWHLIAMHPAVDRRVIDVQSSLEHHLLQVSVAESDTGGTTGRRAK